MHDKKCVVIMAGGTGGHIYPALSCAQKFKERGLDVFWLGSKGGIEETLVCQHDIVLRTLSIKGIKGKGLVGLVASPFFVLRAIRQAISFLQKIRPSFVLGMGGFVAGPGGVAAKLLGIPLVIHEQNAIAGTTNKLLSKVANLNLQAFDGVLPNALSVGNPVRTDILFQNVRVARENSSPSLKLLVVGGSLGAKAINDVLPKILLKWNVSQRLNVWHQTGKQHFDDVYQAYRKASVSARVEAYLENMNQAYYWADIVLCRAGAMTVSELAIAGLPSILVPYPFAIDDHQTANARYLAGIGAAYLLPQSKLTSNKVIELLKSLLDDNLKLIKMGQLAKKVAHPNATQDVITQCLRLIK